MEYFTPGHDQRRKRRLVFSYFIIGTLVAFLAALLVLEANGYYIDSKGQVRQNGLVYINSQPQGASVFVNGQQESDKTNDELLLPEGSYELGLQREGYLPWSTDIFLPGGEVYRIEYPRLFPSDYRPETIKTYLEDVKTIYSHNNKKLIIEALPGRGLLDIYDLRRPDQASVGLDLTDFLSSDLAPIDSLDFIDWHQASDILLVRVGQDDDFQLMAVDIKNSRLKFLAEDIDGDNLRLDEGDQNAIVYLKDGGLYRYDTSDVGPSELLAASVMGYQQINKNKFILAQRGSSTYNIVNLDITDGSSSEIARHALKPGDSEIIIGSTGFEGTKIYYGASGDPLLYLVEYAGQDTSEGLNLLTRLRLNSVESAILSPDGRRLVANGTSSKIVYDFKQNTARRLDDQVEVNGWLGSDHIISSDGSIRDYDGSNPVRYSDSIDSGWISDDNRWLLLFTEGKLKRLELY